jgi:hypothetical protein
LGLGLLAASEEARLTIERNIAIDCKSGTQDGLIVKTSVLNQNFCVDFSDVLAGLPRIPVLAHPAFAVPSATSLVRDGQRRARDARRVGAADLGETLGEGG